MCDVYLMRGSSPSRQPKIHGICLPSETRGGVQEGSQGFSGGSEQQPGCILDKNSLSERRDPLVRAI